MGNQTVRNGTVTVDRVVLPDGGFVVLQSQRYVFDGRPDPVGSSAYLPPGEHRDVPIRVSPRAAAPESTARVAAVAHQDSGGDRALTRYTNASEADPPYRAAGDAVADTASVTVPKGAWDTARTPTPTLTPTLTDAPADRPTTAGAGADSSNGSDGVGLVVLVGVAAGSAGVVALLLAIAAKITRRSRHL
jgi:hypothetical protein